MKSQDAFIIDGCRTAIGNFGGPLSHVRTDDLAAFVIQELMKKQVALDPSLISDVILGCANQAGEDNRNVARMALLLAGLPWTVPGETVNRLCASGMSAVVHAFRAIKSGEGSCFISGGVENMTRGPWVINKASAPFGRDAEMHDSSFGWRFINPQMKVLYGTDSMGTTAENLAVKYSISQSRQDEFALLSQQKTLKAMESGRLEKEIKPIEVRISKKETTQFSIDEFAKPGTSIEILNKLRPAFNPNGSVTAGNSSGLNDGAAAVLVAATDFVQDYALKPLARIVSSGVCGVEPKIMGIGPVPATKLALDRAGLTLNDMQIIELNEAFAAQSLACLDEWKISPDDERLNPNGGAISLGHPLGMSGARIVYSAALELHLTGKQYALCTMCIGVGQGYAVVLENADYCL